jgi:hypothetical protein
MRDSDLENSQQAEDGSYAQARASTTAKTSVGMLSARAGVKPCQSASLPSTGAPKAAPDASVMKGEMGRRRSPAASPAIGEDEGAEGEFGGVGAVAVMHRRIVG